MKNLTYNYQNISHCNMCNATTFKLLGKRLNRTQGFSPQKKIGITTTIMKCENCGLIFSNPLPSPKEIDDHYGIDPEKYWKEEYFTLDPSYFSGEIKWLKKLKKIEPGMKSLDIGAGLGKQMIALESVGFDAYGIEPSSTFFQMALDKMSIPKNKIQNKSIEDSEFPDDFFDFISFGVVLEHIYDPGSALKKAFKWLKKGGIIHIEVPSSNWLISSLLNFQYKIRGMDYVTNLSPMHPPFHLYEFNLNSFELNGDKSGYRIKDFDYYVCKTTLPKFLDPILKPLMRKTNTGMQLCVWLEKK